MAGIVTGSIEHRAGAPAQVAADNNQEIFTILFNYFDSKYTRIASQFGTAGTGFDFFDDANPSGENAFAVWTAASAADPFDIILQWADGTTFGNAPGNPGELNGANFDGVGVAIAMREDATSPWAGGTANAGADVKGTPVWTPGGSTLHCLDRANSPNGGFFDGGGSSTDRENTLLITDASASSIFTRIHIVGDDDGFIILSDNGGDASYNGVYCGAYTPRTGIAIPSPLVALNSTTQLFWPIVTYGSFPGTGAANGGCLGRLLADGVRTFNLGIANSGGVSATYQPNAQLAVPDLEPELIALLRNELNFGLCGYLPSALVASVAQISNHETNAAATRAYMASDPKTNRKWSIPWDAGPPPGVSNTRAGRQF